MGSIWRTKVISQVYQCDCCLGLPMFYAPFKQQNCDITCNTDHIRKLIYKNRASHWTLEMKTNFELTKQIICSSNNIHQFYPSLRTLIYCDASKINSISYIITQECGDTQDSGETQSRVVKCNYITSKKQEARSLDTLRWSYLTCFCICVEQNISRSPQTISHCIVFFISCSMNCNKEFYKSESSSVSTLFWSNLTLVIKMKLQMP